MSWLQISISTQKQSASHIEDVLLANGASSVTLRDAADEPILEPLPGETPVWQHAIVTGLFDGTVDQSVLIDTIQTTLKDYVYQISAETLEDQDWTRSWMDHYQPMQFGKRLWVCPWHIDPPEPDAINLRLDPGLAFGTGTHPTTALCLRWLDEHSNHQKTLLDFGCGSGILGIAALLLGIKEVDAVDIDPQALEATIANAEANQVEKKINTFTTQQFSGQEKKQRYEIVMANILSGPLLQLAPELATYTAPAGKIILSGILVEQSKDVFDAYAEFFDMQKPVVEDDWVLLHGCRKS